jgi:hypothetical protein
VTAASIRNTPMTNATASRELRGNYVLLRADALRLLLPQAEVGAATYLEQAPQPTELAGFFQYANEAGEQPVMALSVEMLPLAAFPADRFFVTAIETPMGEIGFGWSEVSVLIDTTLQAQPLPDALLTEHTPVREFVEIDGHVAFCCDRGQLAAHVFAQPV